MSRLLDNIASPADLHSLSESELPRLAREVRERIIEVVSRNQGHLASNLGAVELTIALHYCFDFRVDRLVWDVGHQCYAHKILTGRNTQFDTLRQTGGITGFPCRTESPYDPFTTGHAGPAISTALGLACADAMHGLNRRVVVALGDGSATAGMVFEGLNHAGALKKNLLVVLNDNSMTISETVGAFAEYLNRIRVAPLYSDVKRELHTWLHRIPVFGRTMEEGVEHLKDLLKRSMVAGQMFEELGFNYFGPVDGHNTSLLVETLRDVKQMSGPILVHVITEKGHGFRPAATDPAKFHSAKCFEYENGSMTEVAQPSGQSYTDCFSAALSSAAERDHRIAAITAAMPSGTGLSAFQERFPDRYHDVGICEQHAVGLAGGLAAGGAKPVVAIYSTFLQRAYDQVFHDVCLQGLPVVFAVDRAGLVGADGPTHHGVFDIAYMRHLPGMVLMAPRGGDELAAMLDFAFAQDTAVAIRYPRTSSPPADPDTPRQPIEMGRAEVLREGGDVALLAYGSMVQTAITAGSRLAEAGIEATVVNARFAKPLDIRLIQEIAGRSKLLVTLEEHALAGGFGAAVLEGLSDAGASLPPTLRLGVPDQFIAHGDREGLLRSIGLDPDSIVRQVEGALGSS